MRPVCLCVRWGVGYAYNVVFGNSRGRLRSPCSDCLNCKLDTRQCSYTLTNLLGSRLEGLLLMHEAGNPSFLRTNRKAVDPWVFPKRLGLLLLFWILQQQKKRAHLFSATTTSGNICRIGDYCALRKVEESCQSCQTTGYLSMTLRGRREGENEGQTIQ